jgi:hypothetical protein
MITIADVDDILQIETSIGDYFSEDSVNGAPALGYEEDDFSIYLVINASTDSVVLLLNDYDTDVESKFHVIEGEDELSDLIGELSSLLSWASTKYSPIFNKDLKKLSNHLISDDYEPDTRYEPTSL